MVLNYLCSFDHLNKNKMNQLIIMHGQLHDVLKNTKQHKQLWQKFLMDTKRSRCDEGSDDEWKPFKRVASKNNN